MKLAKNVDLKLRSLDLGDLIAWAADHAESLRRGVFDLARALGEMEEGQDRLNGLSKMRRYRAIWRSTSEPVFQAAESEYRDAHQSAIVAKEQIESVTMDIVRHCGAFAGPDLEKTAKLARMRDLADELTAGFILPTAVCCEDFLMAGPEADQFLARAMHLLVCLEDEATRLAGRG